MKTPDMAILDAQELRFEKVDATVTPIRHSTIQLDDDGLPLSPQPTTSPYDPLNYPNWLKYVILMSVSFLAFLATLNVAIINPAVVPLSEEFHIAPVTGTYQTTVAIGTGAIGPLIFTPLANVYGRRPVYLVSILIGLASAIGSAKAKSYGALIVARVFIGLGPSAAMGLGAGTVVDLFFDHQRGKAMGVFTMMSTNGSHLAPIVGGYVARNLGWRWCFWTGAILNGSFFVICLLFMPETLFDRPTDQHLTNVFRDASSRSHETKSEGESLFTAELYVTPPFTMRTYLDRLWFWDLHRPTTRKIKAADFAIKPLRMLKYPSVTFPVIYYAISYGFASIEPALTLATIFTKLYGFDTVRNGLANGLTLLIGVSLGELFSGPVTDAMMQRARKRALRNTTLRTSGSTNDVAELEVPAEIRLQGIWTGAAVIPLGLLMYGLTVHYQTTFVLPCIGMALAAFGIQIVTSVLYTYSCGDCYRERSNDVSLCFNLFRQLFGMSLGFYSIPFGEKIGYQWSFTVFTLLCVVTFLPIIGLMLYGERWRKGLGVPRAY